MDVCRNIVIIVAIVFGNWFTIVIAIDSELLVLFVHNCLIVIGCQLSLLVVHNCYCYWFTIVIVIVIGSPPLPSQDISAPSRPAL